MPPPIPTLIHIFKHDHPKQTNHQPPTTVIQLIDHIIRNPRIDSQPKIPRLEPRRGSLLPIRRHTNPRKLSIHPKPRLVSVQLRPFEQTQPDHALSVIEQLSSFSQPPDQPVQTSPKREQLQPAQKANPQRHVKARKRSTDQKVHHRTTRAARKHQHGEDQLFLCYTRRARSRAPAKQQPLEQPRPILVQKHELVSEMV